MAHFRTKARAIDLLGKGQIADLPTAITELWKNGYDAYGDNLEAHLYLPGYKDIRKPVFVISDDGMGMSREDILEKWIVLGTDSKSRREIPKEPGPNTLFKKPRIPTGEKGIGRLSVAYLGSQMLMLTKKEGHPIQALFFDWRITENYNLFVDDIEIPLRETKTINDFDLVLSDLKDEFLLNFSSELDSKWSEQIELKEKIIADLNSAVETNALINGPIRKLSENDHGTLFIIFNPIDQLLLLKDHAKSENEDDETIEYIHSGLSGLSNVFKKEKPPFETKFLIYRNPTPEDFINQRDFFEYKDFASVDHSIEGKFNEYGEFTGKLKVYNEKIPDHTYKPNKRRLKTSFGSFSIKLGYIPGSGEPTTLNEEEFKKLNKRLSRVGGLYLYRDGFRVLPYGRRSFDFLKFEERRSRGTGYYFFSYRRMFGFIEIGREENSQLVDKAGREGLINNKAYREFTKLLIAFFIDLARRYYGTKAKSGIKRSQQEELNQEKEEKEREQQLRKEFVEKLKSYPKEIDSFITKTEELIRKFDKQLNGFLVAYDEIRDLIAKLKLAVIQIDRFNLTKPERFTISDSQRQRLYSYQDKYSEYKLLLEEKSRTILEKAQEKLKEEELLKQYNDQAKNYEQEIISLINNIEERVSGSFISFKNDLSDEKKEAVEKFRLEYTMLKPDRPDRELISERLEKLELAFRLTRKDIIEHLEPFADHLSRINFEINEEALVGRYKLEFEKLKKQWDETQELAQLGIAVEIIDHQFNALYSRLANIIFNLGTVIDNDNVEARTYYSYLQNTFEHLESNYKLLTPLYRSTGRTRKEVTGQELFEYTNAFFEEELKEKNINIHCSKAFADSSFYIFESIIKPVFVNIINNAIYWLKSSENPEIYFDYKDHKMLIINSGEPIDDVYVRDGDLFKLFFSRRPKGRGIGLYLAKTNLNSIGFEIEATNDANYNLLSGACFMIYEK